MASTAAVTTDRHRTLGRGAALTAVTLWGLGPVIVRGIDMPGLPLAMHRTALGAAMLLVLMYARGGRLTWRTMRVAAVGGVVFGANIALFFAAVKSTSVTNATLISALQPALVLFVAGKRFGEQTGRTELTWTALALAGVGLVVTARPSGGHAALTGDLLAVGALITWAWYFIASKQARTLLGALEYQVALLIWATVVVAPVALLSGERLTPRDGGTVLGIFALAIIPGSGHLIMNWAHAHVELSVTSLLTLLSPVITVAAAAFVLSEPVNAVQIAGMALVLLALAAVIGSRRQPSMEFVPEADPGPD